MSSDKVFKEAGKHAYRYDLEVKNMYHGAVLGNVIRRVCIGYTGGYAITAISFLHESRHLYQYTSLEYINCNMVHVLYNFKKVRCHIHNTTEDHRIFKVKIKGPQRVYAGMLAAEGCDIFNKELYLFDLLHNIEIEIGFVVTFGSRQQYGVPDTPFPGHSTLHIDIPMFNPVSHCHYKNTGNMLSVYLKTLGRRDVDRMVEDAIILFQKYITAISDAIHTHHATSSEHVLLENIGIESKILNILLNNGIKTVKDIKKYSKSDILSIHKIGNLSYERIKKVLQDNNISLKNDT